MLQSGSVIEERFGRVMAVVRTAARQLIGADGVTFVLRDGEHVRYVEEDAISPLWKGQRFSASQCVSGWVITHNERAIIADIYDDPRVPLAAYRGTFVKSMAMVPVGKPAVGAIGAYWAIYHRATDSEMETLAAIADSAMIQVEDSQHGTASTE